ncbi:MAG: hypothetical protein A4E65_01552 [Syntrophorhabdus sp. PtaU1.Bin153]|nr:MAG: hypothetical protein A4E65_01552 [Syntrophorhabdus sp. PtaU1.Bin153]
MGLRGSNDMKYSEWARLRAMLHHDWLQNRYLTFLSAWVNCFDEMQTNKDTAKEILMQLRLWSEKKSSFCELLRNAENALSPRQFLETPPLSTMLKEDRQWLGDVVHTLYCQRARVQERVEDMFDLMDQVDKVITTAETTVRGEETGAKVNVDSIITAVMRFSKAIGELPHEIQLP